MSETPTAMPSPTPGDDQERHRELLERAQPALDRAEQIILELAERGALDPTRQFRVRVKIRTRNMPR
jgi:hypothetical protein